VNDRTRTAAIDRIREYVRAQVARTSLRKVARRAGVKVGATKKFVDGSLPYERNLRLWKRFYARDLREGRAGTPDDAVPAMDAAAVLELLLWGLPQDERQEAGFEAVESLRDIYVRRGVLPPAWAHELRRGPWPMLTPPGDGPEEDEDEA
jgi:hypothetical protein